MNFKQFENLESICHWTELPQPTHIVIMTNILECRVWRTETYRSLRAVRTDPTKDQYGWYIGILQYTMHQYSSLYIIPIASRYTGMDR